MARRKRITLPLCLVKRRGLSNNICRLFGDAYSTGYKQRIKPTTRPLKPILRRNRLEGKGRGEGEGLPGSLARRLVSPCAIHPLSSLCSSVHERSANTHVYMRASMHVSVQWCPLFFRESLTEITIDRTRVGEQAN